VASLKPLPTDAEVARQGCADGGHFLLETHKYPEVWKQFVADHPPPSSWEAPLPQPVERCVDHLVTHLIRLIEGSTKGSDDVVLTDTEVDLFARAHGAPAIVGGWPPEGRRPSSRPGSASRKPSVAGDSRPGSAASADGRRRTIVGSPLATVDEAKKLKRRQTTRLS
jgi:hypothetical protein